MLEGLVAWVLNNYLGKYVENLNTDQLSVALLSGKVELENLPLKKDALRHLGLPVEVRAGFIGKVQLQVPVRQIRSAPWLIAIDQLFLVAAPLDLDEWDGAAEAVIAHERKVALLDALEAGWRARHEADDDAGYYAASYSSWLTYGTGLLANIVENLQLKINDVHLRYEDALTCAGGAGGAFACGLTAQTLSGESCDRTWARGFTLLSDADPCSFKLLELQNLALYWDPMPVPAGMMAHCTLTQLAERMRGTWSLPHRYVVPPSGASARVRRERSELPLRSRTRPRLHAHLALDQVHLTLTQRQYNEAVGCAVGLERIARERTQRAYRPLTPVRGHARLWWVYALRCHLPQHTWMDPKPTWASCLEAAHQARCYVDTCLSLLRHPAGTLPPDIKAAKDDFEWRTPLHLLKALREVAMRKMPKATPVSSVSSDVKPASSGRSMLVHWFPQWMGWYKTPADPVVPLAPQVTAPAAPSAPHSPGADLEEEILDVLADSLENNSLLKRDTVFGKFEFNLNKGCLNLCTEGPPEGDDTGSSGLELQFSGVEVSLESRPRAGALALHVALGALSLRDRLTVDTLFPIIVAPQGMIREGLSAMNATAHALSRCQPHHHQRPEPLFQLTYEQKPFGINCDYKLWVKSGSVEVVWCGTAAAWARQFLAAPWRSAGRAPPVLSAPDHTRATIINHWEHIMHPHKGERRLWQVELDISAPQILVPEALCEREAAVLLVDFGRLRVANAHLPNDPNPPTINDDDEETFMTPCSTPPGSLLSPASPPDPPLHHAPLDPANLHTSLYDQYRVELSDMQVLVGRARDNWKYAHTKSTSPLHLLDRFSISLHAERLVVQTADPLYPTAGVRGSLPALVVHLSEQKVAAVRAVLLNSNLLPDDRSHESPKEDRPSETEADARSEASDTERSELSSARGNALYMLHFAIDQMSLEVQSRGRSIAEVQVCGVRVAASARPAAAELSLALSVHSLLLVDALQTYGPDFELLVASHKHLGMDTASGSIRDSEPTSPTSPTSPASPTARAAAPPPPPPHQLHQALYSLYHGLPRNSGKESERAKSPTWGVGSSASWHTSSAPFGLGWDPGPPGYGWAFPGLVDSEALIAVELCFVKGDGNSEDLRIANILFNNLDIIANQETIVELIGFAQRVGRVGSAVEGPAKPRRAPQPDAGVLSFSPPDDRTREARTEITFDFHRLGVLVVRAALVEGALVAKKIAAATVSEARIQATLGAERVAVEGSLGGVQIVSLCEGGPHARVLSVGHPAQHHPPHQEDDKALLFNITRTLVPADSGHGPVVEAGVRVHVASVWYTHSGTFLHELRSCLAEFKQYLANLARSIRAAAQDMALGLVHPRAEGLYLSSKLSQSTEGVSPSPRRRTTSPGRSLDAPVELDKENIILSVCVELESPVVVVPRGPRSAQVVVAHLGRMSLANRAGPPRRATYRVQVRDISLVTLDVSEKLRAGSACVSLPELYAAAAGRPVLHDSALQLTVAWTGDSNDTQCEVVGEVVGGLQVSARREQYEQIVETLRALATAPASEPTPLTDTHTQRVVESEGCAEGIALLEPAVPTLQLDPQLRAAVLAVPPPPHLRHDDTTHTPLNVKFCVGCVRLELRADLGTGERSLVQLAFREFALRYSRIDPHLTKLQVSLFSVTMEDLTKDPESKHRLLLVSHTARGPAKAVFLSKSCPDLVAACSADNAPPDPTPACALPRASSLPAHLHALDGQGVREKRDSKCGVTPPCSPECGEREETEVGYGGEFGHGEKRGTAELSGDDNLVWISVQMRDPQHPHFEDKYDKVSRLTKVEFNCLNLVVSIDSWVTVLDFFGVAGDDTDETEDNVDHHLTGENASLADGISSMEMSIRSLSVVLVGRRGEVCRALVSRVAVTSRAEPASGARTVRARLAALHLADLTPHAPLWRDRFRTHADQALTIHYHRLSATEAASAGHETSLAVEMGPVTYVHTKRFVADLQAFARDFGLLRRVILQARKKVSIQYLGGGRTARQRLRVRAAASVLVVPVAGRSRSALVADLAALTLDNTFRHTEPHSATRDNTTGCTDNVEVRFVAVEGVCICCAVGAGLRVRRIGAPLLPAPATVNLTCTINMADDHAIPDMSIEGTLTTLQCVLSPAQYRVVRGVLAYNLGEPVDDLTPPSHHAPAQLTQVWTTSSLRLELLDVSVRLEAERPLANINFIKSRLLVETYSDLSQDIDLVSQEILVSDARFAEQPANRRGNVFSRIVQPLPDHRHAVQAELHARKRGEDAAYTILVNNMRLMAILDWWEAAMQFILQPPVPPVDPDQAPLEKAEPRHSVGARSEVGRMELKLNITDSQLVLVEDASVWDTNAVILKNTTVIRYGWSSCDRPVWCELSDVEVFSCVLGLEEETALAILEPARLTVTVQADRSLHVSMGALNLRLSYHDMRMFAAMLQSLPAQAQLALAGQAPSSPVAEDAPANSVHMHAGASAARLLATRWLPGGPASPALPPAPHTESIWPLKALHVSGECVTLCVIDDCLDSDVPLLEVSLSELRVDQDLRKVEEAFEDPLLVSSPGSSTGPEPPGGTGGTGPGGGRLSALLSADYYNRMLSGWEPVVEPWRFESSWEYTLSRSLRLARLQADVRSPADLSLTVTSALLDLGQLVQRNWTADYYAPQSQWSEASPKGSPAGHRRRAPFVPYALRNRTGHRLWFTTLTVTDAKDRWGDLEEDRCVVGRAPDDSWVLVRAGDTEPFSFGRGPRAAPGPGAAGALAPPHALHRLALALDHWTQPDPICVDRVGRFFRNITHKKSSCTARLVLEVSLEGSARKLVSVRSALQLVNRLPHAVEVRADLAPPPGSWSAGSRATTVHAGEAWAAPVSGEPGVLWVRPLPRAAAPPPRPAPLDWRRAILHQPALVHADCSAPPHNTYRFCCAIVRDPFPADRGGVVAGHTLTLVPALRLENLLPVELQYRAAPADDAAATGVRGALAPSDTRPFHEVNVEDGVELSVKLEGFGWSSSVCVGGAGAGAGGGGSFSARLKLRDARARRLYLNARVHHHATDGIKVTVSAAYWLVNRTGLPLVFRAEGGAHDAAGQFEEHEVARAVAPLLFCFAAAEGGPTVSARLGRDLAGNGTPEWSSPFGLGPGTSVKKLVVRESGGEERVYAVGVSVRAGRGRYRRTNIATFAPRYHLHNNTRQRLQFAQKCTATTLSDPGAMATHVTAVAGCYLPWHWARWDRERLLCVRVLASADAGGLPLTAWSGGFGVEVPRSLHLACREPTGAYRLLRVEVAVQAASLFIVVSEAEGAPPPLRIDNYSPVAIMFHQVGCSEECVVSAHARVRWALPEPQGTGALALRAPGGPRTHLPLDDLRDAHHLLYQNFIYVVFTATLNREGAACGPGGGENEGALVLEVPLGSTRVVLGRKRHGDRCQLWRAGPGGQLVHEGSSPPQPSDVLPDDATLTPHDMVLDIEGPAPRPGRPAALVLRRSDGRRGSTQTWRLHGGRMACAHANLYLQPDGGLMALKPGSRVVLGLPDTFRAGGGSGGGGAVPPEQAVSWHTLRPGSGRLEVTVRADGPTRQVRIRDHKEPESGWIEGGGSEEEDEEEDEKRSGREWGVSVRVAGVSVSLVGGSPPAELFLATLGGAALDVARAPAALTIAFAVADMQIDNQLLGTPSPVLLYCLPERGGGAGCAPALHAAAELLRPRARRHNARYFRHFVLALRPMAVRLEERLILKLWSWAAPSEDEAAREEPDEADYETRRVLDELTALHATRYYFSLIRIMPSQIRLSMCTASKLEGELAALKRRLALTLIRFEDAAVELEPFQRAHCFDTAPNIARQTLKHFKDELKWQAAKILGSVDFLGNPLGFVADVSEGVSGLLLEGNVSALLKNVTHGISNSAAKVTESLGDGLERVVSDEAHEETRRRIRSAAPGAHLAAGFRGLGLGILGGMTSLVKHSYEGAAAEGLGGFLTGVGKGLVGTVTKPVIGVLDLATETAAAVRDTSRRSDKCVRERVRAPRCVVSGALLPRYCAQQADGAALLHALSDGGAPQGVAGPEALLAYRVVRGPPHDIRALISTTCLRIVTCKHNNQAPNLVMETHLSKLVSCTVVSVEGGHFVELGVRGGGGGEGGVGVRRPRVQCDSAELAAWVARHAALARQLHHDLAHTLPLSDTDT